MRNALKILMLFGMAVFADELFTFKNDCVLADFASRVNVNVPQNLYRIIPNGEVSSESIDEVPIAGKVIDVLEYNGDENESHYLCLFTENDIADNDDMESFIEKEQDAIIENEEESPISGLVVALAISGFAIVNVGRRWRKKKD